MANTGSQAEAVRDLLVERLELYDATLDVSEGSALWTQVVEPVFEQLGTDPFDTDIRAFLKDRVTQAFPNVSAQDGDALVDLLITPLEVLLEPLKREIQIIRNGQSARVPERMRLEDARDLAANFFIEWKSGSRATGVVRVYFAAPTYLTVLPTVEFTTSTGLVFYPSTSFTVRPETMLLYRSGSEYYVDVAVTSADSGAAYNASKGSITSVKGISGYTRIANLAAFEGAADAETAEELLARVKTSLAERTLNVRRGIVARIESDFASITDVEVVGYGDPEMNRDIVTGGGEGSVVASGVCFIVGQFVLMFSMFEDRGSDGSSAVSEGDEIELNFWSFLYSTETGAANEKFTIDTILFDSRNSITQLPSVLLFRIDGVPSVTAPVVGMLPGVLPGVFAVVRGQGKIEISDIPGGILEPDTLRGTVEINDGEVHIGGHYDVWLRSSSATADSTTLSSVRSESSVLEGADLVVSGESARYRHVVHRTYTVSSTTSFTLGSEISCADTGAAGTISRVTRDGSTYTYELWEMSGVEFAVGDSVSQAGGTSGLLTSVSSQDWEDSGVARGMTLALPVGTEEGAYRVLKVDGPFLYVDINLTTTAKDQLFRVLDEVTVNLFDVKAPIIPFGDAAGDDLRTTIGSSTVRTGVNLQDYGAETGDTLEILDGDDAGTYTISSWDSTHGGLGPVLNSSMTATNSSVSFKVYKTASPLQRPLLRIVPDGVLLLDGSEQDSGYRVPNAIPVDVRPVSAFSGAKSVASGLNGFVLMDPGPEWAPSADYTVDIESYDWTGWTDSSATSDDSAFVDFYAEGNFRRVYTDEALASDGYIAVISVHGADGQMYLDSALPDAAKEFLVSIRTWLLEIIATFGFGGDEEELVNAFSPLKFGPNEDSAQQLLMQFEIIIPFEVFDGCNNVFVALPEFDWKNEFAASTTFDEAIGRFNDGAMAGKTPSLLKATAGDVLTITSGLNAGSYVIERVETYALVNARAIVEADTDVTVDLDKAYKVGLVVIRDEFPVPALQGLPEFFAQGATTVTFPAMADLPFTVTDADGDTVDGWTWVETALTWFFKTLNSLGFDLPEGVTLDVPGTLEAFWQMLFSSYVVGRPTAPQYLRMYFQEPTSCTVYAPQPCSRYAWAPPVLGAEGISGAPVTLPLADLEGLSVSMTLERLTGPVQLSGTLTADFATVATIPEIVALLQELLDAEQSYVTFRCDEGLGATGALEIVPVVGGVDEVLYVTAISTSNGFRWLGFHGPAPAGYPEISTPDPASCSNVMYEQIVAPGLNYRFTLAINTTLVRLVPTADLPGTFQVGEAVSATNGATGTVWALATGAADPSLLGWLWVVDSSGTFVSGDVVEGATSGATFTVDTVESDVEIDVSSGAWGSTGTFEEVAAFFTTAIQGNIETAIGEDYGTVSISSTLSVSMEFEDQSGTGDGPGRFVITIEDTAYPALVVDFSVDSPDPVDADFAIAYINSTLPATSSDTVLNGMDYTPTTTVPEITVSDGVTPITWTPALTYWQALDFKANVCDLVDAGDFEGAAQALNALEGWVGDGTRRLLWVDASSYAEEAGLAARGLVGGTESSIAVATYADYIGFSTGTVSENGTEGVAWVAQGTTTPGEESAAFEHPHAPTLFSTAIGATEALFTPSSEADPYQVFPGQTADGDTPATELPRDIVVGTSYDGQSAVSVVFTDDDYGAPLELDIREESDWLYLYEQRRLLEHTDYSATDTDISADRVVAVVTTFGSNKIKLLDMWEVEPDSSEDPNEFTFLAPNSGLDDDQVQVGDIVFIEEGDDAAGYVVVERSAMELVLDRNLTESTERVYRFGSDGVLVVGTEDDDGATFTSASAAFTSDDVGRYLTLWACNREDEDGSYKITAVEDDGTGCTLDTDIFTESESDVHWVVVKAPTDAVESSEIGGRTALLGLRPIRVYSGEPVKMRVVDVTPTLSRTDAIVMTTLDEDGEVPRNGVRQPYKFVRPGTQHISSTAMKEQRERGLYYFDVLAQSLGGDSLYNVPRDTKMEPVFGTYDSYGYRIDVDDNRYTFSTKEEAYLVLTSTFLPAGLDDELSNLVTLHDRNIRIDYEHVPAVAQVQGLLVSDLDRVLCANPLARHFLPAYVSIDITYVGGNKPATVAGALQDFIDSLSAVDVLDLSELEKILHDNGARSYDHPIRLTTLTHDLDRRIVGTQSEGVISDDNIAYNGTNRTTFFIAGDDASSYTDEADIPPGARIRLTRSTTRSTLR